MRKITSRSQFVLLLFALVFISFLFSIPCAQSPQNERLQNEFERQISENTLDVTVWVFLFERYKFFDLDIQDEVVVDIVTNLTEAPNVTQVISALIPFSLTEVTDLPPNAYYTYGFWGLPPVGVLNIYLPANTSYSSIKLKGHISGSSVFWRNTAEIRFMNISNPVARTSSYKVVFVAPSYSKVLKIYSRFYPNLNYIETGMEGQKCVTVYGSHPQSPVVILYEPRNWEIYTIILMMISIFMVYAVPYTLESEKVRIKLTSLISTLRELWSKLFILKKLYDIILKLNSSKFLTVYILCALLMISLSFAVGPDPRPKVYVLVSTPENARTISKFVYEEAGAIAITVYDEMNEFDTLTNLGVFSAVIIGDFFPPDEPVLNDIIYPALYSVRRIIIVESYAYDGFSSEIQRRYPDKIRLVENLAALGPALPRVPRRENALGLSITPTLYEGVSAFVGVCSFVIVFFGLAFLASKLIEVGKKPGVAGFPEAITYAVFIFVFTQTIYVVCSVLLAVPLGLHTSSPKVTAIGFLGFGGGTTPRRLSGLFGFLFGALISLREGLKLDKNGFAAFLVLCFFLLMDPLTGGIIFYEFVLLFTVGPSIEYAYMSSSYTRNFLGTIIRVFGAWVSPIYAASTGIVLYYTGATSFFLFPKLKKKTATASLLLCAFCASSGIVRVADMRPWKTISGVIPGVMTGFLVAALFCVLSLAESFIKSKMGKVL